MKLIYPNYYKNFKCTQSACRHNCCIGWEIDIDEETLKRYRHHPSIMAHIQGNPPHFALDEQERCPFLQEDHLCEIICHLGEDALCDICASHPRFHNEFTDHTEVGLGLCCEAAARLILNQTAPVTFNKEPCNHSTILNLQDRRLPIGDRLLRIPDVSWYNILHDLERMDNDWDDMLNLLKSTTAPDFDLHMKDRQYEYEQLAVYLLYRHNHLRFASLGYHLLHRIGSAFYRKYGQFTFEDQVELCRLFSCEIEYSEQNLKTIFSILDQI